MTDSVPLLLRDQRHSLLKASLPMGAAPAMRRNAPPPEEEAMVFEMSHEHCGYDCETSPPSAAAARHEVGRGGFSLHAVEPSPVEWWAALVESAKPQETVQSARSLALSGGGARLPVLISLLNALALRAAEFACSYAERFAVLVSEHHAAPLSPATLANVRSGALLRWLQGWCIPRLCCEQGISPAALHAAFYLHQGNPVVRAAAQALRALVFLPKAS